MFTVPFNDLETQEHTLGLEGANEQGDGFTETFRFAVDALAPVLQILSPASGAFTETDDTVRISGRTGPGATVKCVELAAILTRYVKLAVKQNTPRR